MDLTPLPIDEVLADAVESLRQYNCLVVRAPTGAGKTTRVPPAVLDGGLAGGGQIVLVEPRRLAARAAARRMTAERGGVLGEEIGYQVRFDRRCGPRTRIVAVTPGILLRRLQDDPLLESASVVIFDEFHERSLECDLALAMVRLVQETVRPDLRIVVMSATLAVEAVSKYLGDCPIIASEGRLHPVEMRYEPKRHEQAWPAAAAQAVARLLNETDGDILVFLPGLAEIRRTARHLDDVARQSGVAVTPLYGDLPAEQQDAALLRLDRRKVVLATNVAETSVTVEGISAVVDTGLARQLLFDPAVGLDRLKLTPISRASAEQRAGRAGRLRPGICVRLWSESAHRARAEQTEPEIRRVDLAGAVLQLLAWGEKDLEHFPWLEPPRPTQTAEALRLLERLGAVESGVTTDVGKAMARVPVQPRLGRLLIEGQRWGQRERIALATALLAERDLFRGHEPRRGGNSSGNITESDLLDRIEALEEFEQHGSESSSLGPLNRGAAKFVLHARDQLARLARQEETRTAGPATGSLVPAEEAVMRSLLAAFPDRLARRRPGDDRRAVLVGGRGVRLAPSCGVSRAELFVCLVVDAGHAEAVVRSASAIKREWLPAERVQTTTAVLFDADSEKVIARQRLCYEDLVIEDNPAVLPGDEEVASVLAAAAADRPERVLPPADSPAGNFLIRLRCLRQWMPELGLPAVETADLKTLLPQVCRGCRSFEDLRRADWLQALHGLLTHVQRAAVDREAPERLQVPSGSRLALHYQAERPPVLAVRIQEVFGWRETPRIAGGRVRVLLHLLAPNYRPQQVTDDLASFWANTYPQVRKELRARYPKHAWPEDPWTAVAERRPNRR